MFCWEYLWSTSHLYYCCSILAALLGGGSVAEVPMVLPHCPHSPHILLIHTWYQYSRHVSYGGLFPLCKGTTASIIAYVSLLPLVRISPASRCKLFRWCATGYAAMLISNLARDFQAVSHPQGPTESSERWRCEDVQRHCVDQGACRKSPPWGEGCFPHGCSRGW